MKNGHGLLRRWLAPILLSFFVSLAPLAGAQDTNVYYVAPEKINVLALLAPPPLPGSDEQAADLAEVTAVHRSHPASEEPAALQEDARLSLAAFAPVIGIFTNTSKLPQTVLFFKHIGRDTSRFVNQGKNYWKRDRPYVTDPSLLQGGPVEGFSYPSGHSTSGTVTARVLAEMFPEKRDALLAIGRSIGWHRVMIARHYPTDVVAGRVLAQAIVRELDANPQFQHDLAAAKAEILTSSPAQ
jgi:acid phosphatase (class A)